MFIRRIARIVPELRSVGWFVLGWTMLAHASTGAFAFSLAGRLNGWLRDNAWAGFLFGLLVLTLAVVWPEVELKLKLVDWVPQSPGSRLNTIEVDHLPKLTQKTVDLGVRIDGICNEFKKRLGMVEMGWSEIIAKIPDYVHIQFRTLDLMSEAAKILTDFNQLRNMYGRTISPAVAPFSQWRPPAGSPIRDEVLTAWELWARNLERHIQCCAQFYMLYSLQPDTGELVVRVATWSVENSTMSGDHVGTLLQQHGVDLRTIRENHAARWTSASTISSAIV